MDAKFKATLVNSTKWQYYGTPGYSGSLVMEWGHSLVNAARVNVELWGYAETGESAFSCNLEILKSETSVFEIYGHLLVGGSANDIFSLMLTAFQQKYWL